MKANLRIATKNDIELLQFWDSQEHVRLATGNDSQEFEDENYWDTELSLCNGDNYQYYIAQIDNQDIACVLIINPATEVTHYWGDIEDGYRAVDIWIGEIQNTSKGYGTLIMQTIIKKCFEDLTVKGILIDPLSTNLRAIKFYQRYGFKFLENRTFGEDNCDVYYLANE